MPGHGVQGVDAFGELLEEMLKRAQCIKQTETIVTPLVKSDISDLLQKFDTIFGLITSTDLKKRIQYAVIETAVRDTFNRHLASTSIDDPAFIHLWDLLDIISILSDDEQCDPALLLWLVEELLDSQTVAGCRKVFEYLESRREIITAKHFSQKNLVILRSCNELLRRLSRAEDTAFCGQVFIFLFQSFPLGDKSSVNLRGEFHTENVTTFDETRATKMDVETMEADATTTANIAGSNTSNGLTGAKPAADSVPSSKGVTFTKAEKPVDISESYPIFWSLQEFFNQPKKLFDPASFAAFKAGLETTMAMFISVQNENQGRSANAMDESKRGTKRKRSKSSDDLANSFNPKYLTSRDLFELEISDLSFRRNILVQVLIVLDFLLSLSSSAKEKLGKSSLPDNPNKSVMYADQTLNEEDKAWCQETRKSIADYLKQGLEGQYYFRMVETVLTRDKNWARWKVENCPSISKPAVTPETFLSTKFSARKTTANKRLRPNPLGSLDLTFLAESENQQGLERLKDPSRYQLPPFKSFQSKIELDDMDIDMARDEESKTRAVESKASKSWRALRIASGIKLVAFDKIERADKIDEIFRDNFKTEDQAPNADEDVLDGDEPEYPEDRRCIVICGPRGVGKSTLVNMLLDKHSKIFEKKISHTTRPRNEGEIHGVEHFFIDKNTYDTMRDGDEFLEYNTFDKDDYATSIKMVEDVVAQGKVPLIEMGTHGIQQLKDRGYPARLVYLTAPDVSELEHRLKGKRPEEEETGNQQLEIMNRELEQAQLLDSHDKSIANDDLEATFKELECYIFGHEYSSKQERTEDVDVEMVEMAENTLVKNGDAKSVESSAAGLDRIAVLECGHVSPEEAVK